MLKARLYSLAAILILALAPCKASSAGADALEIISIRADEAIEDIQPDILHFKGHFRMQSRDWQLESGLATVYGPPDRPDKVDLKGSPARFLLNRHDEEDQDPIEAIAPLREYLRSTKMLTLSGGATIKLGEQVIRSKVIEYNIDTDRYRAGGADGVVIMIPTVD